MGSHYYPVFPYTSYTGMTLEDIKDLYSFLQTLPPVAGRASLYVRMTSHSADIGTGLANIAPKKGVIDDHVDRLHAHKMLRRAHTVNCKNGAGVRIYFRRLYHMPA